MPSFWTQSHFLSNKIQLKSTPPMESSVGYSDYLRIILFAFEPELATNKCFAYMPLELVLLINSWLLFFFVFCFSFPTEVVQVVAMVEPGWFPCECCAICWRFLFYLFGFNKISKLFCLQLLSWWW
jgi:hypothetical protein